MTLDAKVKQLLSQAETSLGQIHRSLASAEPVSLASSQRCLIDLVEILSEVERYARKDPSLQIRQSLLAIRTMLGQSKKLSSLALAAIARQMESRNLFLSATSSSLCVEG